jgi:hypothetical protein
VQRDQFLEVGDRLLEQFILQGAEGQPAQGVLVPAVLLVKERIGLFEQREQLGLA